MTKVNVIEGALTDADYAYIEGMAIFFNITLDEAYQRFLDGNFESTVPVSEFEDDEDGLEEDVDLEL